MGIRYCIEIAGGPAGTSCFAYVDSPDGLADIVLDHLKVDAGKEMVFRNKKDPYRIILCRIPQEQREAFFRAIDLLPAFMAYDGRADYEDYCRGFFTTAYRYMVEKEDAERILTRRR